MLEWVKTTISGKLILTGLLAALGSIGIIHYCSMAIPQLLEQQTRSDRAVAALQHSGDVDMLHDTVRAVVSEALYASAKGRRGVLEGAQAEVAELEQRMKQLQRQVHEAELTEHLEARIIQNDGAMNRYVALATEIVQLAARDPAAAEARLPGFLDEFRALEESNAAVSDAIAVEVGQTGVGMRRELSAFYTLEWVAGSAAIILTLLQLLFIRQRIVRPVERITAFFSGASERSIATECRYRDELGQLARSAIDFRAQAAAAQDAERERLQTEDARRTEREAEAHAADEAARASAEAERRHALMSTAQALEARISGIATEVTGTTARLRQIADVMAESAHGSQAQTTSAAAAAQQTLDGVIAIAEAADEMVVSINEVSSRISQVATTGNEVRVLATTAKQNMDELASSAQTITGITGLIASIASRTNLLALNASIEAAQAGERGRGFAIVASEVKELANQTATAVGEIDRQLSNILAVTRQTENSFGNVAGAIEGLAGATSSIATAAEQQGQATHEITRTIHQSSTGTEVMRDSIAAVSSQVALTASNAAIVREAAISLDDKAAELGREISDFIVRAKAA